MRPVCDAAVDVRCRGPVCDGVAPLGLCTLSSPSHSMAGHHSVPVRCDDSAGCVTLRPVCVTAQPMRDGASGVLLDARAFHPAAAHAPTFRRSPQPRASAGTAWAQCST